MIKTVSNNPYKLDMIEKADEASTASEFKELFMSVAYVRQHQAENKKEAMLKQQALQQLKALRES